jgi:hypothetical protein
VTPLGDEFLLNDALGQGVSPMSFLKSLSSGMPHIKNRLLGSDEKEFLGVKNLNPTRPNSVKKK